jgi:opacity protein-like surface antigen
MKLRNLLLATSALATVSLVAADAQAGDWYISVLGGANFTKDKSFAHSATFTAPSSSFGSSALTGSYDADTGFIVGAAVGKDLGHILKGLRGEVEVTYRRNRWDGGYSFTYTTNSTTVSSVFGSMNGHVSSWAIMANAWYDIDLGGKFKPYLGGGIGWAKNRYKANVYQFSSSSALTALDETDSGFAYQLGAGFNLQVSEHAKVGVGYRYADLGDFERSYSGPISVNAFSQP